MIFTLVTATPHRLVYDVTSEATPETGTRTNAQLLADAVPGSPLAGMLAETSPDFQAKAVTSCPPKDVVAEWAVVPQLDGSNNFEVDVTADTTAATATLIVEFKHSTVR